MLPSLPNIVTLNATYCSFGKDLFSCLPSLTHLKLDDVDLHLPESCDFSRVKSLTLTFDTLQHFTIVPKFTHLEYVLLHWKPICTYWYDQHYKPFKTKTLSFPYAKTIRLWYLRIEHLDAPVCNWLECLDVTLNILDAPLLESFDVSCNHLQSAQSDELVEKMENLAMEYKRQHKTCRVEFDSEVIP